MNKAYKLLWHVCVCGILEDVYVHTSGLACLEMANYLIVHFNNINRNKNETNFHSKKGHRHSCTKTIMQVKNT